MAEPKRNRRKSRKFTSEYGVRRQRHEDYVRFLNNDNHKRQPTSSTFAEGLISPIHPRRLFENVIGDEQDPLSEDDTPPSPPPPATTKSALVRSLTYLFLHHPPHLHHLVSFLVQQPETKTDSKLDSDSYTPTLLHSLHSYTPTLLTLLTLPHSDTPYTPTPRTPYTPYPPYTPYIPYTPTLLHS